MMLASIWIEPTRVFACPCCRKGIPYQEAKTDTKVECKNCYNTIVYRTETGAVYCSESLKHLNNRLMSDGINLFGLP